MMSAPRPRWLAALPLALLLTTHPLVAQTNSDDIGKLIGALLGDTPMLTDLQQLADGFGGRATGSEANRKAVEWALARFKEAGVEARAEAFTMPALWLERNATATVRGSAMAFSPRVAALPYSAATPAGGLSAPLVDGGVGDSAAFAALGSRVRGAWVLVAQEELRDIEGLFREYALAGQIEQRAWSGGAAGLVYMGSRPNSLLYRHNLNLGTRNPGHVAMVMERDGALRAQRLLQQGTALTLSATLELSTGPAYQSSNVIGEIRGSTRPDEVVLIGAHFDSWDLGSGVLDNGANAMMVLDIARQIRRLGLRPSRTLRFALWNGEEQGIYGSLGYTKTHAAELDRHVMTTSIDIGTGRITGFLTGGRPEVLAATERAVRPLAGLGPFTNLDIPIVGTDNFDFMLEGVANLVANQESANYGPNYHARSDEFAAADQHQLRLNGAIIAAMTLAFAEMPVTWTRQSRADIERLVATTDLQQQMESLGVWADWTSGIRGRKRP